MKTLIRTFYFILLLTGMGSINVAFAQQDSSDKPDMSIKKGSILTGFSAGWTGASRDSYNHEFERSFREFSLGLDALYFVTDHIALGPELEYRYLYRDLEDPPGSDFDDATDRWNWEIKYGAKAGFFAPVKDLFGTSAMGNSTFFTTGGFNWLSTQTKVEGNDKSEPFIRPGFSLSTGFLIPLGRQIGLETKLQYEARRQEYSKGRIENGTFIITDEETRWPSTLSLGVGLKVAF